MKLSIGFLLFLALAALLVVNGIRAFLKRDGKAIANGVVSFLAAVACAFAGYYLFQF